MSIRILVAKRKPLTGMTLLQITKRELITRVSLFQNYEKRKLITWMSLTKSRNVTFPHVCHCYRFTKRELLAEMPQNLCLTVCMASSDWMEI